MEVIVVQRKLKPVHFELFDVQKSVQLAQIELTAVAGGSTVVPNE